MSLRGSLIAFANWLALKKDALFCLIYFFGSFYIYHIPHNYVIPQVIPYAISQTHSACYPHRLSTEFTLNHPLLPGANNRNVIITHRFLAAPVQASDILTVYFTCKYFSLYTRELRDCLLGISPSGKHISLSIITSRILASAQEPLKSFVRNWSRRTLKYFTSGHDAVCGDVIISSLHYKSYLVLLA